VICIEEIAQLLRILSAVRAPLDLPRKARHPVDFAWSSGGRANMGEVVVIIFLALVILVAFRLVRGRRGKDG
jgi:hypothetical protein